jgi:hypothetical protein
MRSVLTLVLLLVTLSFYVRASNTTACAAKCPIPDTSWDFSNCNWYDTQLEWLPTAYAKSAKCACELSGVSGRTSPSSYCVRNNLLKAHQIIPSYLKEKMRVMKKQHCNLVTCSLEYLEYIEHTFISIAYDIHVKAYSSCCCPRQPASLIYWKMLMGNYKGFVPCSAIVAGIQATGSCGCEGW